MNSDAKRYYAILGVDPTCSDEEIRLAFRRRAKELHPDSESGSAGAFIRLKRAYDTLGDPANRARYDRAGRQNTRAPAAAGAEPRPAYALPRPPRQPRPGGISFARYATAFLFMAALSYGAIEVMISLADVPPGSTVRPAGPSLVEPRATARSDGPASGRAETQAKSGFWDPASPDGTPRDTADQPARPPRPAPSDGLAAWPSR